MAPTRQDQECLNRPGIRTDTTGWDRSTALGQWRLLPIMANGQPGATGYLRRPGETGFYPFVLTVLRFEHGRVIEIAAFEQPSMFTAFGLPASL